ncbi:MAG: hypothetical protein FWG40_09070 [Peptococcaceae bacterium]|nr:hypothetical protein [Peptococcaceae bacterium]
MKKSLRIFLLAVVLTAVTALPAAAASFDSSKYDPIPESAYDIPSLLSADFSTFSFNEAVVEELIQDAAKQPVFPDKNVSGFKVLSGYAVSIARDAANDAHETNKTKKDDEDDEVGTYPTRYGVILVTSDKFKDVLPLGHAAIIWTTTTVVEALDIGVITGPNNWNTAKSTCYAITTYGTTAEQDALAANYCYNQVGKPYNWNFLDCWTRSKFYCSHLIYAAYLDLFDIDLDTPAFLSAIHPMELVNSNNTYLIYVKQ